MDDMTDGWTNERVNRAAQQHHLVPILHITPGDFDAFAESKPHRKIYLLYEQRSVLPCTYSNSRLLKTVIIPSLSKRRRLHTMTWHCMTMTL